MRRAACCSAFFARGRRARVRDAHLQGDASNGSRICSSIRKRCGGGAAGSELYTIGMLSARDALRTDPLVIAALDDAWSAATAAAGSPYANIDFDGYMALSRKLYLACFAENSDSKIDPNEFRSGAEDEWLVDSADTPGYLSKDAFMKSWFELADVHARSLSTRTSTQHGCGASRTSASTSREAAAVRSRGGPTRSSSTPYATQRTSQKRSSSRDGSGGRRRRNCSTGTGWANRLRHSPI